MSAINLRNATHTPKSKSPSSKLRKIFTLLASFVLAIGAFGTGIGVVYATVTISQNIQIGSGTPDLTLDGDDLYVTGTAEVDGTLAAKTGGGATFVVAASDASDRVKNQADYLADGTADNVEIQAAIDALPDAGGKVVLSEGTFNVAVAIEYRSYVTVEGQGYGWQGNGATVLKPSANINVFDNPEEETKFGVALKGFTINGDGPNRSSGIGIRVYRSRWGVFENIQIYRTKDEGILIDDFQPHLESELRGVENRFKNVMLYETGDDSIHLVGGGSSDNLFETITIRGSQEHGMRVGTGGNQFNNVHIYSSGSTAWEDNGTVGYGVLLAGAQNIFTNCQVEANDLHGFLIAGAVRNVLVGNSIYKNGQHGGATRYGINVTNNSDYTTIEGNLFTDTQATPTQSGINIDSTSDNNLVMGNTIEIIAAGGVTIADAGAGNIVRDNIGHRTESLGTSTIPSAATRTTVTHGLAVTPAAGDCTFVGAEDPTNSVGSMWIDTYTSTQMNLNVENDPGASNYDVAWTCSVY
jgi:hypothetical protein